MLRAAQSRRQMSWGSAAVVGVIGMFTFTGCAGSGGGSPAPTGADSSAPAGAAAVETNPPGDIPDSVAYVAYASLAGHYSFKHPEGWSAKTKGSQATFSDKLNGIFADDRVASVAPTAESARSQDVPSLRRTQPAFELRSITSVNLPAGPGVRITYRRNSAPDAVTGKVYRDEVQRYEIFAAGREVTLELYGPVGADNVDPYTIISQSLRLS